MKPNKLTREEFEQSARLELGKAVDKAKEVRNMVRLLEKVIAGKEEKIQSYQKSMEEIGKELVNIQIKLYADGTT